MEATDPPTLHLVIDAGVPAPSVAALRRACAAAATPMVVHDVRLAPPEEPPTAGDAVLSLSGSVHATEREVALVGAGLHSVHRPPRPWFEPAHPDAQLERAGIPVLASQLCPTTTRSQLRDAVAELGGLPVVVKVPGGEQGIGVMLAPTWPALHSVIDHLLATGVVPRLQRFLPNAEHWRVIVVGGRAVATYRNSTRPDDFRSSPSEAAEAPADVVDLAVRAADALLTDWAGVDVLVASDEAYVIEANTPCSLTVPGVLDADAVAGALVAHLVGAPRLGAPSAQ